jgi:hypothetical protein
VDFRPTTHHQTMLVMAVWGAWRIGARSLDSIRGFRDACMGKLHPEFLYYYFIIGF